MRIYYKESKEIACPYCGDRSVLPGYNSFASKHKDLLQEWDYVNNYALVDPDQIGDSDRTQVWMICRDDPTHKYETSVADRLMFQERGRNPCPYCKGRMRKRKHFVQK
ncbi:MAG: zinc-ribbon domain-containing protein [Mogibacterium sp.]|nr:zinc-ribbon domain-containing protein [Mogibacterium sp.]